MLLDSQTVWWLLTGDRPVGKSLMQKLNKNHIAFFSAATVFEFFQKAKKGKLRVPDNLVELIRQTGLQELQINAEHASDSRFISPEIYDPFDRMLLAQAQSEKIDFYTSDRKILSLGLDFVKDVSL
jgi:PIN domain nuclease of toxin-antitoxin system